MNSGVIQVAKNDGFVAIKMQGDVRLTLSVRFDEFIDQMFNTEGFRSVVFDLSEAESIDSTTLGLMAKISLKGRKLGYDNPLVMSPNTTTKRLLDTMGFEEILGIVETDDLNAFEFQELSANDDKESNEDLFREKVLEAHKALIELNSNNEAKFKELIESLERFNG